MPQETRRFIALLLRCLRIFLKRMKGEKNWRHRLQNCGSLNVCQTISMIKERRNAELKVQKEMTLFGHLTQVIDTFSENSSSIWDEIDLLEGNPVHRGTTMCNLKFKPFWVTVEETEWSGLWEKGVFKKWNRKDLSPNDRVFTSRYVYKIK